MIFWGLVRGQHQQFLGPREGDVVQAHAVKESDATLRFEGRAVKERSEVTVNLLGGRQLVAERPHHHYWELKPLRLVDSHYLHKALGERLIRVFVFVDATVVQQPKKAVKQAKS